MFALYNYRVLLVTKGKGGKQGQFCLFFRCFPSGESTGIGLRFLFFNTSLLGDWAFTGLFQKLVLSFPPFLFSFGYFCLSERSSAVSGIFWITESVLFLSPFPLSPFRERGRRRWRWSGKREWGNNDSNFCLLSVPWDHGETRRAKHHRGELAFVIIENPTVRNEMGWDERMGKKGRMGRESTHSAYLYLHTYTPDRRHQVFSFGEERGNKHQGLWLHTYFPT